LDLSDAKATLGDFCRDEELQEDQYGGWDDIPVLREDRGVKINRIDAGEQCTMLSKTMWFDLIVLTLN
jgi:hypothetical protein